MDEQQAPSTPTTNKNPFRVATIVLSIVVLGLAGFLAYTLIEDSSEDRKEAQPVSDSESPKADKDSNTDNDLALVNPEVGPYIKDGYFIVPHWGQKFKLSNEMTDYGYSVSPDSIWASYDNYVVGLTAVFKEDLVSSPQARYYATIDFCSIVTVSKTNKDMSNTIGPKKTISFDDYSFVVYDFNAHGGCVDMGNGLMTTSYYDRVADKLTDILSKPENI